jgi:hypothetical protein
MEPYARTNVSVESLRHKIFVRLLRKCYCTKITCWLLLQLLYRRRLLSSKHSWFSFCRSVLKLPILGEHVVLIAWRPHPAEFMINHSYAPFIRDSVIRLWAGNSGFRITTDRLWGLPPASYSFGTGVLSRGLSFRNVKLRTHLYKVPRLRMSGAIIWAAHTPSLHGQGKLYLLR